MFKMLCAFAILSVSNAKAVELTNHTACKTAVSAYDVDTDKNPDGLIEIRAIFNFIKTTFLQFDNKNHTNVIGHLSSDGLNNMVALVVGRCRQHPNSTIFYQTSDTYIGLRAFQQDIGVK